MCNTRKGVNDYGMMRFWKPFTEGLKLIFLHTSFRILKSLKNQTKILIMDNFLKDMFTIVTII